MRTGTNEALVLSIAMAAAIFFCRIFPFLFFRGKTGSTPNAFLAFVEKTVPPVAMTVLAFNSLAAPLSGFQFDSLELAANLPAVIRGLAAAGVTAALHLWRLNPLLSIFGGTALYMVLLRAMSLF